MKIDVKAKSHTYTIHFGGAEIPYGKVAVVSDENVWNLHGESLRSKLKEQGIIYDSVIVKPGEGSKSVDTLKHLYSEFCRFGIKRGNAVICFGGGVAGDLGGFAAATYMRGVPLVMIPTTLLAQVDSSVGGKVAVNLDEGKNLVGSFYQPNMVIIDTNYLDTLPHRELLCGIAEAVKYGVIGNRGILDIIKGGNFNDRLDDIVYLCCKSKVGFVENDEFDLGERMMLNFGHTFGHAIEKYYGYKKYNHGEAVAIGMVLAVETGKRLGLTDDDTDVEKILGMFGMDLRLDIDVRELIQYMGGDKKNDNGTITLVLLKKLCEPFLHKVPPRELEGVWA